MHCDSMPTTTKPLAPLYPYSTKEVATALNISKQTLITFVREGRIQAANLGTGKKPRYRFREEDVTAYLLSTIIQPLQ